MIEFFNSLDVKSLIFGIAMAYICNFIGSIEELILEKACKLRAERKQLTSPENGSQAHE